MNTDLLDQTFPEERADIDANRDPFAAMPDDQLARLERAFARLLKECRQFANRFDWYKDLDYDLFRIRREMHERQEMHDAAGDADLEDHS